MKIKTKKQLNLPQLIEWAMENDITNKWYRATDDTEYISEVFFNVSGLPQFSSTVDKSDTFTVEVEEEVTEDKWFSELVIRTVAGDYILYKQGSINDFKHLAFNDVEAIYIPNDDLTMTLIWRDGKLVE